jgi:hypothetical protein
LHISRLSDFLKVMTAMESRRPGVTSPVGRITGISVGLFAPGGFVTNNHDKPGAAEFSFGLLCGFDILILDSMTVVTGRLTTDRCGAPPSEALHSAQGDDRP